MVDTAEIKPSSEKPRQPEQHIFSHMKEYVKGYLHNLNPKDKSWAWKVGAIGSAGLSAYLAINTGGMSLLAKSLITSAASVGFQFLEKGMYTAKENKLKRLYEGSELAEKIKRLYTNHKKGVDKVAAFFGGASAGAAYTALFEAGTYGVEKFLTSHPDLTVSQIKDILQTSDLGKKVSAGVEVLQDKAASSEYAQQLGEINSQTHQAIDFAKDTYDHARQNVDAIRGQIHTLSEAGQTIGRAVEDVQAHPDLPPALPAATAIATAAGPTATVLVQNREKIGFASRFLGLFRRDRS